MLTDIRPAAVAGAWYPGEPSALHDRIGQLLRDTGPRPITGRIWGLVVPHAGYTYSGPVAASAFASLQDRLFDVVAVLAPYHEQHPAPMLTSGHAAYRTPLGPVQIHSGLLAALNEGLKAQFGWGLMAVNDDREHSVEIQLPFLQYVIGDFRLLPIMLRTQESEVLQRLGLLLAEVLSGENALVVASSDLSHFYHQEIAAQFDAEFLRRVEAFDPQAVLSAEGEGAGFACGAGPVAAALWAARALGADRVSLAAYATSGNASGDYDRVVGYGSAVLWERVGDG